MADRYGNETRYVYDELGRLITAIFPTVLNEDNRQIRPTISYEYDIQDHVVKQQDANGNVKRTSYNSRGKPVNILYPDGSSESFTYFLDGALKEKTDRNGNKTIYERDSFGRVVRQIDLSSIDEPLKEQFYHYQGSRLLSMSDKKTFTIYFKYDEKGRQVGLIHETKEGKKRVEWTYDESGQKTGIKEWLGPNEEDFVIKTNKQEQGSQNVEAYGDEPSDRGQKSAPLQGCQEDQSFYFAQDSTIVNDRGQTVRRQEIVDGNGRRDLIVYDALNRVEQMVKLNAFGMTLTEKIIRHDANGNKKLERHHVLLNGKIVRAFIMKWSYDSLNQLTAICEGADSPCQKITSYYYNQKGQLERLTNPNGTSLFYLYNPSGRLTNFYASDDSVCYRYQYDGSGRLTFIEDLIHSTFIQRFYNDRHELVKELFSPKLAIVNDYDLAGRRVRLVLPDQSSVSYQYDGLSLKAIERLNSKNQSLYAHRYQNDSTGEPRLDRLIGHCGELIYANDSKGRISGVRSPWWSENIAENEYDAYQQVTGLTIEDPAGKTEHRYAYTDDNQLAAETGHFNHEYEHDSLYNRVSCDDRPWLINDGNQLMETPTHQLSYDGNGNLNQQIEKDQAYVYFYDALNRLIRVEKNKKEAMEYVYDSFHRRLSERAFRWDQEQACWQKEKTNYFLYDGNKEIGKVDENGQTLECRVLGVGKGAEIGAAIAIELGDRAYAPIHDHQGSVRCLIEMKTGSVQEFYRYSAYGLEEIFNENGSPISSSTVGNPWRFSSKRVDDLTGLVFFGNRYYAPALGRWTTPDPLFTFDAANVYSFVQNDPLSRTDLYGLFSIGSIWNQTFNSISSGIDRCLSAANNLNHVLYNQLQLAFEIGSSLERLGKNLVNDSIFLLTDHHFEETEAGTYGEREISEKLRITFINGILTDQAMLIDNLNLISQSHGGMNVHYIFRATEGWMWDISRGLLIKTIFALGFRSLHAQLLAKTWKSLIEDMGGVGKGGQIIHYAHSLGGSDTDRARDLLSPEEQDMIRIISIGSATMIRNTGFQNVTNYVSLNDGVSYFDPLGRVRNLIDSKTNIIFKSQLGSWNPYPLCDHSLNGITYRSIVEQLGERFLMEFCPN